MIISRVFSTLIRLNHMIKLDNAKTQLLKPSRLSVLIRYPEPSLVYQVRAMSVDIEKELNDPKRHLDYNQLIAKMKEKNVFVIDVRERSEIKETGKIPGSINIPLAEVGKALGDMSQEDFKKEYSAEKVKKDAEVIFSCKAGVRSFKGLKLGLELGYSKAAHYKGGWLDWVEKTKPK